MNENNKIKINEKIDLIKQTFLSDENIKKYKKTIHINKKTNIQGILENLIKINNDDIVLDYRYFKLIAIPENYNLIIETIVCKIKNYLIYNNNFIIHVYMKNITLTDVDKHYSFICKIAELFKTEFPDKLEKCYIYNAPFIFTHIFSSILSFIDKKTQLKIQIIHL